VTHPIVNRNLYTRYLFFKDHAGYCVGRKALGALALAKAEIWAEEKEVEYRWDWDDDGDLGDHHYWCSTAIEENHFHMPERSRHTHEILWCAAYLDDACIASLSGIIDPDNTYRRVIEAELALEAYGNEQDCTNISI
jgi:hypothetical protein